MDVLSVSAAFKPSYRRLGEHKIDSLDNPCMHRSQSLVFLSKGYCD